MDFGNTFSESFENEISQAYQKILAECPMEVSFAVRSSATAEDLPMLHLQVNKKLF